MMMVGCNDSGCIVTMAEDGGDGVEVMTSRVHDVGTEVLMWQI